VNERRVVTLQVTTRDGRHLHAERHGQGTPVVVMEAGLGLSRNMWGAVVDEVASHTSVVLYDRSGLGRSAGDAAPRDLARLAEDLVDVLAVLGDEPTVLVGHSWGGPVVRAAASLVPERIAALVLVDQTDERCDLFFGKANQRQVAWSPWLLPLLAKVGVLRRFVAKTAAPLPEPWRTAMRHEDGTAAAVQAQVAELAGSIDDLRRLRTSPVALPDVPVSVISGAKPGRGERHRRPALIEAHAATAAASPQGRHVLAERSGHLVPLSEPEVVVNEILRVAGVAVDRHAEGDG
jgi:pimeloyl-ACP methyl ester carboxylesterase